jgi:ssDNA thymidine ADP-ribosyltransferase, DarT
VTPRPFCKSLRGHEDRFNREEEGTVATDCCVASCTPCQLAERLNISLVTVLKALVAHSQYVLPDQTMNEEIVVLALRSLGYEVTGGVRRELAPEGRRLRSNWPALHLNVGRRGLRELYHFTALANVPSILKTGTLLSRHRMAERGIQPVQNNWGSSEKERLLGADYICLSLTKDWAMMCSLIAAGAEPPVLLAIEPRVIWYEGSCFSPGNSARRDISATQLHGWNTECHFDALFPDTRSGWPCDPQAEILARDEIALDDVRHIVFRDRRAWEIARQNAGLDQSNPYIGKVLISDRYFPLG